MSASNEKAAEVGETSAGSLLPHLESLERMMQIPIVGKAWSQSQEVYDKVRGKCLVLQGPNVFIGLQLSSASNYLEFALIRCQ